MITTIKLFIYFAPNLVNERTNESTHIPRVDWSILLNAPVERMMVKASESMIEQTDRHRQTDRRG